MRISDWSSDVCSSDLAAAQGGRLRVAGRLLGCSATHARTDPRRREDRTMPVSTTLFDLTGRTILITGASRGIGFAMAEACAAHGARVVLNGRDPATLATKVDALVAAGHDEIGRAHV